jgi:NADH-quinone oxidoreductase subunit H
MNTITMSGIIVTLFLGGPQGLFDIPFIPGGIEGTLWFVAKLFVFLYVFVWFRATLPRLRYDQLMDLGWKVLIPLSLGWFLLLAALRVGRDEGWSRGDTVLGAAIVFAALAVCAVLLMAALAVARRNREKEEGIA